MTIEGLQDRIRRGVAYLLLLGHRGAKALGLNHPFYRLSFRFWQLLCGQAWIRQSLFSRDLAIFSRFVRECMPDLAQDSETAGKWLLERVMFPHLELLLATQDARIWEQSCVVKNERVLLDNLAAGSGVIVVQYHSNLTKIFRQWLKYRSIDPGVTLWFWTKSQPKEVYKNHRNRSLSGAAELLTAIESLANGGVVQVLADGYQGNHGVLVSFFHRQRYFQPTFAELSLMTGAATFPVGVSLDDRGSVSIEIAPTLDPGDAALPRDRRICGMIDQYTMFLSERWRNHPATIRGGHIVKHLQCAPAED